MYTTHDNSETARVKLDCKWIETELDIHFSDACCENFAHIIHIATLSEQLNQYAVEIIQDFGFGREYTYRMYKVGQYCKWQNICQAFFNELVQYVHA